MILSVKPVYVTLFALIPALPGMAARFWLLHAGTDDKGLLNAGHPGSIASVAMTVIAAVTLLLLTRHLYTPAGQARAFPASRLSTAGAAAGVVGIGIAAWNTMYLAGGFVRLVMLLLGIAATVCAGLLAVSRSRGLRPGLVLRSCITVFFMMYLVLQYRAWSAEPQLQRYLFQLLALLGIALANYYRACVECGQNQTRALVLSSQMAMFLCLMAIPGCSLWPCYAALAVWMALDTYAPVPLRRRRNGANPEA